MLVNLDVRQVARPLLKQLSAETGAVAALTTRDRLSMLYLECCRSTSVVTLSLDVGSRIPLATSASGLTLLATIPASERADLMERIRALDEGNWPQVERGILTAVEEYHTTGCATSADNWVRKSTESARRCGPGGGCR